MAHIRLRKGDFDQVREPAERTLEIFARVRDLSALTLLFEAVAGLAVVEGDRPTAARFAGAAHRIKNDTGVAIGEVDSNEFDALREFLVSMDEMDQAYFDEGFNTDLDVVIARVREFIAAR